MNWLQLKTLLWLRWRLSWNQLRKGKSLNLVLAVVATVGGYSIAIGSTIGGFFVGWKVLGQTEAGATLLAFDIFIGVFLFSWIIGLLNELQRSELIDIQRLMHLPISLPQLFFINYLASHFTFTLIVAVPALCALSLGMMISVGWRMILLLPLSLAFVVLITAWTYYLRGWLVSLMVNQRRKRAIMAGLTITVIVIAQTPNFYFNFMGKGTDRNSRRPPNLSLQAYGTSRGNRLAHQALPPLWLAKGALALRQGSVWPALGGTAALSLLTIMGLTLAYRSTLRFYTGESSIKTPGTSPTRITTATPPATNAGAGRRKPLLVEWNIPFLRSDTAGLALASFRGMIRAPEVKMMLLGPLIMMIVFYAVFLARNHSPSPVQIGEFAPTGMILLLFFSMNAAMLNQFGFDRDGFRALVLLPTPRKQMVLAKNLAFAPLMLIPALIALVALPFALKISVAALAASVLQLFTMYLVIATVGNIYSIGVPFRINAGSLKPTKSPPKVVLLMLLSHLLYPVIGLPILIPPAVEFLAHRAGWMPGVPLNLILSGASLLFVSLIYLGSLEAMGIWLQRREKDMLATLTQEVE